MRKTLIIVAHPDLKTSTINKRWTKELQKYPDTFTIHDLYAAYPDGKIDILAEQSLVDAHENLVFQFPMHWYSCPPLLQQWFDDVLTYKWGYGRDNKLLNKKITLGVSAGVKKRDFSRTGRYHYTIEEALTPFVMTFRYYIRANFRTPFVFYGTEEVPGEDYSSPAEDVERSAREYVTFLNNLIKAD